MIIAIRRIVAIGDIHVGSRVAPWLPHTYQDGSVANPSPIQERLNEYWMSFWKSAGKYDTVLLLGDLCDGNNRKEFGRNLTSVELEAQVEVCRQLLLPHCKGKKVYGVSGSPYHESLDVSLDKLVVEGVGGQFLGLLAHLDITGTGKVIQLRHGDSASLLYRETDMARESMFLDMVQGIELPFTIDLVVRGHWHWFAFNVNRRRSFLQVPGWKLWFPWRSGKYGKFIPDIGGCVLEISKTGITCQEILYPYIPCYDALQRA